MYKELFNSEVIFYHFKKYTTPTNVAQQEQK